jgi:hypothetical protein
MNWCRPLVELYRLNDGKDTTGCDKVSMSRPRQRDLQELSCTICIAIFDILMLRRCMSC